MVNLVLCAFFLAVFRTRKCKECKHIFHDDDPRILRALPKDVQLELPFRPSYSKKSRIADK
jgi:hypothetical protein